MSVRMSTWVWQHSAASGNDLLLLLALADIADDTGKCWPSVAHLAEKTRLSRATVQRRLHTMTEEGRLRTEDRKGTSNVYYLRLESGEYTEPKKPATRVPQVEAPDPSQNEGGSQNEAAAPSDTGGVAVGDTGGASPGATRYVIDSSVTRHEPRKRATTTRATQLPDDWAATPEMRQWARGIVGAGVDLYDLTEHFKDHHLAKGSTFKDWNRAWQTWVRNSVKFGQGRRGQEPPRAGFWGEAS